MKISRLGSYEKSDEDIYLKLISRQSQAIERAKENIQKFINDNGVLNPERDNPSTTVFELIEYLNTLS